jgi:hypothetical protein
VRGSPPGLKDTVVRAQASSSKMLARCRVTKKAPASAAPPADKMDEMYVVYIDDIALVTDSPIVHKHIVENRSHVHPHDIRVHAIDIAACSRCKGKNRAGHKTPWLLDLGASNHYTNNLDDYVDYTAWPKSEHRTPSTATSNTRSAITMGPDDKRKTQCNVTRLLTFPTSMPSVIQQCPVSNIQ